MHRRVPVHSPAPAHDGACSLLFARCHPPAVVRAAPRVPVCPQLACGRRRQSCSWRVGRVPLVVAVPPTAGPRAGAVSF